MGSLKRSRLSIQISIPGIFFISFAERSYFKVEVIDGEVNRKDAEL